MTVRIVVIPGTVLLVPGAAGGMDPLRSAREVVLSTLRDLLDGAADVTVLAVGAGNRRGPASASLAAAGISAKWLGWSDDAAPARGPVAGVAASVGILALRAAGWHDDLTVLEVEHEAAMPPQWAMPHGWPAFDGGRRLLCVDDGRSGLADRILAKAQQYGDVFQIERQAICGPGGLHYQVITCRYAADTDTSPATGGR